MKLPPGFTLTKVVGGLTAATAMAVAPDGRVFVCEQTGALRVIKDGQLLPEPFLTRRRRQQLGARADRRGTRSRLRSKWIRLRHLRGGRAVSASSRQPVHRAGRRGRRRQRGRAAPRGRPAASSAGTSRRATRAGRCTSAGTASSTSPSASRPPASPPSGSTPSRASCCGSTPTARSPTTIPSSRRQRGSTARSGRSACATRSPSPCSRDGPDLHQRRGGHPLGGGRRGLRRGQLRLARVRGRDQRPAIPRPDPYLPGRVGRRRGVLPDRRRSRLSPAISREVLLHGFRPGLDQGPRPGPPARRSRPSPRA